MPRTSNEYDREQRDRIIAATRRCLARLGFRMTSMSDILAEAGISASTFYRHFSSKADALRATGDDRLSAIEDQLAEQVRRHPLPRPSTLMRVIVTNLFVGFEDIEHDDDDVNLVLGLWAETGHDHGLFMQAQTLHSGLRAAIRRALSPYAEADLLLVDPDTAADLTWNLAIALFPRRVLLHDAALERNSRLLDSTIYRPGRDTGR